MTVFPFELLIAMSLLAMLYSMVGHGGASGYLAAMAIMSLAPDIMRPTALVMNSFVASLVLMRLSHAHFNRQLFIPLIIASVPMAWLGGSITLHAGWYKAFIGLSLIFAAYRMFITSADPVSVKAFSFKAAMFIGGVLGLVSGLTGVGGGIFLSPILFFLGWVSIRGNVTMAAAFILVNSLASLGGYVTQGGEFSTQIAYPIIAAILGALVGSELAARKLSSKGLVKILGVVLLLGGAKMLLQGIEHTF